VRETLVTWDMGALAEPGVLIASELATNAVVHAQTASRVVLLLMYVAGTVRLEVRDDDPVNLPVRRNPAYSDIGGRGLVVVEALSQRWGVRVVDASKSVWAELDITPPGTGSEL
jgi:anti-sigma regulatory factor (Ser/Thr protein kinase)